MQNRRLRTGLALLLSAMLLGSVTPPVVQHAHAEGDRPHDHSADGFHEGQREHSHPHSHAHPHSHSHSHPHSHPPNGHGERDSLKSPTMHRHVTLFGFELYLPVPDHQDLPDHGANPVDVELTLVRLVESRVVLTSAPAVGRLFVSLPPSLSTVAPCAAATVHAQDGPEMLSSLPLCDSARGERSGVQLI